MSWLKHRFLPVWAVRPAPLAVLSVTTSALLRCAVIFLTAAVCVFAGGCGGGASSTLAPVPNVPPSAAILVTVTPQTALVPAMQAVQFAAAVQNTSNSAVNWSVDGVTGGNTTLGTISSSGLYTAPPSGGTHTVKATSIVDATRTASASVTVIDPNAPHVVADFGMRLDTRFPVPPDILYTQWSTALPAAQLSQLASAGFSGMRLHANIELVYNTQSPDWTWIDPIVAKLQSAGLHPIMEMVNTPPWLVPTVQGCPNSMAVPPTNVMAWAQLAASYVAHFDQKFPGFVQDYEIWNEPDLSTFCVSPNDDSTRLSEYLSLYAAAASQMRAQAASDGQSIRIGGPAIISPNEVSVWIPALLSNTSTAPYVDFVSYHRYLSQQADITAGMTWDDPSTGSWPLYNRTQDSNSGEAAVFKNVAKYVRAGSQPNAATTPIYLDEYNDNSAFALDCCRNSAVYSPIWNALVVADLLNTVYQGLAAVPSRISYYSSSNPPFCLLGALDANMDCASSSYQLYPQYLTYQLLASGNYLGLSSGAHMATSISPSFSQSGIEATAFYNAATESIVIINPTATDYSQIVLQVQNSGLSPGQATLYQVDTQGQKITSQPLTLTSANGGLTGVIALPRYTMIGIAVR